MARIAERKPHRFTIDENLDDETDLPLMLELVRGVIGPFSDRAKLALLANRGADKVIAQTGPEDWRQALQTLEEGE